MSWTEEREAWLRNLIVSPEMLSATQIGAIMGVGRGAIIGKVWRMDLTLPNPRFVHNVTRRSATTVKQRGRTTAMAMRARARRSADGMECTGLPSEKPAAPVSLLAAKKHHCRWPVSEDGAPLFMFCGAAKADGSSYCWKHAAMSINRYRSAPAMVAAE